MFCAASAHSTSLRRRPRGVQLVASSRTEELDNDYLYGWSETPCAN
jgi:hypothetical protein